MRKQSAAVFVIAIAPAVAAAQQFLTAPPGVDPSTRFEVVAINDPVSREGDAIRGLIDAMVLTPAEGRLGSASRPPRGGESGLRPTTRRAGFKLN